MAVYDPHPLLAISSVAAGGAPSPATSGTSLTVASGEGTRFGSTFSFNATVCPAGQTPTPANSEIVRISARPGSADTLTIARAQEGSSARTIVAGDLIFVAVTPKALTDLETNTEYAFSSWKDIGASRLAPVSGGQTVTTLLMYAGGVVALNTAGSVLCLFYLDPTWYAPGARTSKVRVCSTLEVGGVAPGVNFTVGLASVATWGTAGSNARGIVATLSAALVSSTYTTPLANTQAHAESSEATLTAGYYVLYTTYSGTTATNSQTDIQAQLQRREI